MIERSRHRASLGNRDIPSSARHCRRRARQQRNRPDCRIGSPAAIGPFVSVARALQSETDAGIGRALPLAAMSA